MRYEKHDIKASNGKTNINNSAMCRYISWLSSQSDLLAFEAFTPALDYVYWLIYMYAGDWNTDYTYDL